MLPRIQDVLNSILPVKFPDPDLDCLIKSMLSDDEATTFKERNKENAEHMKKIVYIANQHGWH